LKPYGEQLMELELFKEAKLTCDLPEHRLRRAAPVAVTATPPSLLKAVRNDECLCARRLAMDA
jgi:hypothetical protein